MFNTEIESVLMLHPETLGIHINRAEMIGSLILSTFWWRGISIQKSVIQFKDVEAIETQVSECQKETAHSRKGGTNGK